MNLEIEQRRAIDVPAIERELAGLWREQDNSGEAVVRAALWNVVAHTGTDADTTHATEVLRRASAFVPQRSIIIRSNPSGTSELTSWINASCHIIAGGKQVCSEQITIVAGGDRTTDVPSIVNALLIPDMPVATLWLGDLPAENDEYLGALLESAERFIVDSQHFDGTRDLVLLGKIAAITGTLPADINWLRLEEWRLAAASLFDPPFMRERLQRISAVRISQRGSGRIFGETIVGLYFTAWLATQAGFEIASSTEDNGVAMSFEMLEGEGSGMAAVEIEFRDGTIARIHHDSALAALRADVAGIDESVCSVTRFVPQSAADLVIAELSHMHEDRLFPKVLDAAVRMERRWR